MLRGADEIEVLPLDLVHHVLHLGKTHHPAHHLAPDHEGRDVVGEAPADHKVPGVGEDGRVEPGHVPLEVIEPVAGGPPGGIQVDAVQALHDVHVVGHREVGHHRVAEPLQLHVLAVILADGHRGVDDVGDDHHPLFDLLGKDLLVLLQPGHLVGHSLHLSLGGLRLLLAPLCHHPADLLGNNVALVPQLVAPCLGGPILPVKLNDLVHQRQLLVLELPADVLLNDLRVVANKFHVQHFYKLLCVFKLSSPPTKAGGMEQIIESIEIE